MKDNKLIAEFMGLEYDKGTMYGSTAGEYYRPLYNSGDWVSENELQYHTSWDWLMPVVEKIMWDNDIEDNQCTNIEEALCDAKIDRVYDSVVEFIKQYNNE